MQNSARHSKSSIQMDTLLTKPRQNFKPQIHNRIFWLHNVANRRIFINTFTNIRRGNGALALHHKEKKEELEGGKQK